MINGRGSWERTLTTLEKISRKISAFVAKNFLACLFEF
jgi:hypothetical protein